MGSRANLVVSEKRNLPLPGIKCCSPFRVQPNPHTDYTINMTPMPTINLLSTQHIKFYTLTIIRLVEIT